MPPLYILRHGETEWNRAGRLQGGLDSPLTALGRVQAARQGAILRAANVACAVRCSPQGRARQTAALAGVHVTTDDRLCEVGLGEWEGQSLFDLAAAEGILWKFDAPRGESLASVDARLDALLSDLSDRTVLITHGVVSILLRARLTGRTLSDLDSMDDPQGVVHLVEQGRETLLR